MTASLPVPNDIDPEEPDRHTSAPVVPMGATPPPVQKPRTPRKPRPKRAQASAGSSRKPAADAPTPLPVDDPGPPPPLPSDLEVVASVAAGIVVPPKPPLPPARDAGAATSTDTREVAEPPAVVGHDEFASVPSSEEPGQDESDVGVDVDADVQAETEPDAEAEHEAEVEVEAVPDAELAAIEEARGRQAAPLPESPPVDVPPDPELPAPAAEPAFDREPELDAAPVLAPEPALDPESKRDPDPEAEASEALAQPSPRELPIPAPGAVSAGDALVLRGVTKRFGSTHAVDGIDLTVPAGTFYGLVGPNGAGKTTTLSMIAGLLEPDKGSIRVGDVDAAAKPLAAKKLMGVLPDRLRTFDRLTGRQLLYYYGVLRGLRPAVVESRTADLARAFDLSDALGRSVSDYSAGMLKKVMLAGALIHSPRLLVLDEPFEAVDPVSSAIILDILSTYVAHGGTVILSSHGMELVERVCSRVAVIVAGQVLAEGTVDEVRGELTLEQRFVELAGGLSDVEGLEWLHTFSD